MLGSYPTDLRLVEATGCRYISLLLAESVTAHSARDALFSLSIMEWGGGKLSTIAAGLSPPAQPASIDLTEDDAYQATLVVIATCCHEQGRMERAGWKSSRSTSFGNCRHAQEAVLVLLRCAALDPDGHEIHAGPSGVKSRPDGLRVVLSGNRPACPVVNEE